MLKSIIGKFWSIIDTGLGWSGRWQYLIGITRLLLCEAGGCESISLCTDMIISRDVCYHVINAVDLLMSHAQVGLSQRRFYHMAQGCFLKRLIFYLNIRLHDHASLWMDIDSGMDHHVS